MPPSSRWLIAIFLICALALSACGRSVEGPAPAEEAHAKVERIPGTQLERVVLTERAAKSLGIRTAFVRSVRERDGGRQLVVPYAAVFYDAEGRAFTYTNPSPLTYVRQKIVIDDILGKRAFLTEGPAPGSAVVTVGTDELLGVEEGVQE